MVSQYGYQNPIHEDVSIHPQNSSAVRVWRMGYKSHGLWQAFFKPQKLELLLKRDYGQQYAVICSFFKG